MKALVILYDSQISNAITLQSLAAFATELSSLGLSEIIILNNGPSSLSLESACYETIVSLKQSGISIVIQECLANAPLSHIYNRHTSPQEYTLIFDDDSQVTASYLESLESFLKSDAQILIPLIYANDAIFYPYLNGQLTTQQPAQIFTGEIASISSGMCLSPSATQSLQNQYHEIFDSRFNIYGVDTTFFLRAAKSQICSYFVGGRLNHKLSRATEDHLAIAQFRYEERLCDIVLQLRHYLSFKTSKYFQIFIKRYTLKRFLANFPLAIKVLLMGRHPRTNNQYLAKAIALDPNLFDSSPTNQTS